MATYSSILAWKIPWMEEPGDTTELLHFHLMVGGWSKDGWNYFIIYHLPSLTGMEAPGGPAWTFVMSCTQNKAWCVVGTQQILGRTPALSVNTGCRTPGKQGPSHGAGEAATTPACWPPPAAPMRAEGGVCR